MLELRRYVRVTTYELLSDPPEPLVPRYLRLPIDERVYSGGEVAKPVDPGEIAGMAEDLKAEGVEFVAIGFLHAYRNPANEQAAQRLARGASPGNSDHLLGGRPAADQGVRADQHDGGERLCAVRSSHAISTNLIERLLERSSRLRSRSCCRMAAYRLAPETAAEFPVRLIESGPVAGAMSRSISPVCLACPRCLAYDMGGTTAKACLIRGGRMPLTDELEVARSRRFTKSSGFPVAIPAVNMIEIGAGGGSIARVNALGIVQVGPESAGGSPGPACYGRGGSEPTVTDADLVPRLPRRRLLRRRHNAARPWTRRAPRSTATRRRTARLRARRPRWTIHDVVNETMASAVRMHVSERGGDPRRRCS